MPEPDGGPGGKGKSKDKDRPGRDIERERTRGISPGASAPGGGPGPGRDPGTERSRQIERAFDITRGLGEQQRAEAPAASAAPGETRAQRGLADVATPSGRKAIVSRFRPGFFQGLLNAVLGTEESITDIGPVTAKTGLSPVTSATFERSFPVSPIRIAAGLVSPLAGLAVGVAQKFGLFDDPLGFDFDLETQTRTAATTGATGTGAAPGLSRGPGAEAGIGRGRGDFRPPAPAPARAAGPIPSIPVIPTAPRPRIGVGTTLLSRGASPVGPANIRRRVLLGA